ncbi:MAG TPA: hypothetical protein VGF06_08900, partial [Terriglobales bacterium]
ARSSWPRCGSSSHRRTTEDDLSTASSAQKVSDSWSRSLMTIWEKQKQAAVKGIIQSATRTGQLAGCIIPRPGAS